MNKHQRWMKNVRAGQDQTPSEGNPGVIALHQNHIPKLPSMQGWRRATSKQSKKPGPVKVVKGEW